MEDFPSNNRSSFSSSFGFQSHSNRPKLKPVRVKALLCESDDDDSDDNEAQDSIENSDSEAPQASSQSEIHQENEKSNNAYGTDSNFSPLKTKNTMFHNVHLPSTTSESIENVFQTQRDVRLFTAETYSNDISKRLRDNYVASTEEKLKINNPSVYSNVTEQRVSQQSKPLSNPIESINKHDIETMPAHTADFIQNVPDDDKRFHSMVSTNLISNDTHKPCLNKMLNIELSQSKQDQHIYHHKTQDVIDNPGFPTSSRLVTDTPIKHLPVNSMRPHPCLSHKKIFQTPQSKLNTDTPKNVETPVSFPNHALLNVIRHTPFQDKKVIKNNHIGTPGLSSFTPNIVKNHDFPRSTTNESRTTRRPLMDACTYPLQSSDNNDRASNLKSQLAKHAIPSRVDKTNLEFRHNTDFDHQEKKKLKEKQNSGNETKENVQSSMNICKSVDNIIENEDKKQDGTNVKQNNESLLQETKNEVVQSSRPIENKEPYKSIPVSGNSKLQQNMRQLVNKMSNLQSTVRPQASSGVDNKLLTVKSKEYLILGTLGKGMSGEVYRVQDILSSELRAIKCVNLSQMDKEAAQGCLDEISMLHKLQAPSVIQMFDYEFKFPMVYVVMEMGDTDLSRLLKSMPQQKQLPLTMILYYWTEMLTAVKHIHDNGVIHSDLKPANFLLVRGRLKLIDFGIASSINADMTSVIKNSSVGTLNYISPEAVMDVSGTDDAHSVKYKITFKSDVWSLGCILYMLVYGYTPFQHIRSQWAKVSAITNPKPNISFPTTFENGAEPPPPILIEVMRKCLQHDPKARPTVAQLLQVQYIPTKPTATREPDIHPKVLVKIKNALTENEWRHLLQVLESKRNV